MQALYSYFFPEIQVNLTYPISTTNRLVHEREEQITNQARKIASNMQLKHSDLIQMRPYEKRPLFESGAKASYINEMNMHIYYNYLALIEAEDVPLHLRLIDDKDPKQLSDEYVNEVIDWIKTFFGLKELHATDMEKMTVVNFLRLCIDPQQWKLVKEFIIAHELSHLYFKHADTYMNLVEQSSILRKTISISTGLFGSLLCTSFTSSLLPALGIGSIAYKITEVALSQLECLRISRQQEKEADLFAVRHVGVTGGIAWFQCIKDQTLFYLKNKNLTLFQKAFFRLAFDSKGDSRIPWFQSHPSDIERINYLSTWGQAGLTTNMTPNIYF